MPVTNPTESTWKLEILERSTQKTIATAHKYSATASFASENHATADITITDHTCDPIWRQIRQRGHWVKLQNKKHPDIALIGPIVRPPTWDLQTGAMRIQVQDWLFEPLEQELLKPFTFTGNLVEAARALITASGIEQPPGNYRTHSFPIEGLFPIDSTPPREVREWWQSLTLAGLTWTVLGEVLQLGLDPDRSVEMSPSSWSGKGVQLSHEEFANLIIFDGEGDLIVVYPETDYRPTGFYPLVPFTVRDPKVSSFTAAQLIARRTHERKSNPALIVQGVDQIKLPWPDCVPGTPVELTVQQPIPGGRVKSATQASVISRTEFTIADGVETSRTIRVQPIQEVALEVGPT